MIIEIDFFEFLRMLMTLGIKMNIASVVIFFGIYLLKSEGFEIDCTGEHYYRDEAKICKKCEECPSGYEPTPYLCGYGIREPGYECKPCDVGSYSSTSGYQMCKLCDPCEKWNSIVSDSCTSVSNAKCGKCVHGFYRPTKTDGNLNKECVQCTNASEFPSCENMEWKTIAVILIVTMVGVMFLMIVSCALYRRSRIKRRSEICSKQQVNLKKVAINEQASCTSEVETNVSEEDLDANPGAGELQILENNRDCIILNQLVPSPRHDEATYSNLPTAEYNDLHSSCRQLGGTLQSGTVQRRELQNVTETYAAPLSYFQNNSIASSKTDGELYQIRVDSFDTDSVAKSSL